MRVGVAIDHGGFDLKQEFVAHLRAAGHEVIDFGAHERNPSDGYPDFVIPLAQAVAAGSVERGVARCRRVRMCQQGSWNPGLTHPRPLFYKNKESRTMI